MNITINTERLKQALRIVERVVGKNVSLPILNAVRIEAKNGNVVFSATNLEVGIVYGIGARVEKEGDIAIPIKVLSDFVLNISDESIKFSVNKDTLSIYSAQYKTKILGLPTKDFPIIPKVSNGLKIAISPQSLKNVLTSVVDSTSLSETRPELSGVYLSVKNNNTIWAGTDSFRLSEIKESCEGDGAGECIIPRVTVLEMIRLADFFDEEIKITIGESQISFIAKDFMLVSRLIDGKYPDYRKVIPESYSARAVVAREELERHIRMASVFSSSISDLFLESKDNTLFIEAKNTDRGEISSHIKCKTEKGAFRIAVNFHYLLDGIKVLRGDEISLEFTGDSSPLILHSGSNKNQVYVIMPLRT